MDIKTDYEELVLYVRGTSQDDLVHKLMSLSWLKGEVTCIHCCTQMQLGEKLNKKDGYRWICYNKACEFYKTTISLRNGSFFSDFKASLRDLCTIIYCWLLEKSSKDISKDFAINKNLITRVFHKLRKIIGIYLDADPIRLGGPGVICQIDESLFSHKVKAHRGRAPQKPVWVFGIVDTSYTPGKGYMQVVADRTSQTLLSIIQRVCRQGTIVYSDEWAAYKSIQKVTGLLHKTVNHSVNFVDPITGVHTQNVESFWCQQKQKIKSMKGIKREHLPGFLNEMVWRSNFDEKLHSMLVDLLSVK